MRVGFDGDDQLNSVRFGGVDSMEMEESVGGNQSAMWWKSRPSSTISDFYRYSCIKPPN